MKSLLIKQQIDNYVKSLKERTKTYKQQNLRQKMQQMQSKKQQGTELLIESGTHIDQKQSFIQLFKFVQQSDMVNLTKEAVDKLGFSCGYKQNCNTIIQMGGIQLFTNLLNNSDPDIVFGAIRGIGNIGVYFSESFNLTQIIPSILQAVQRHSNIQKMLQHSVWCLINSINSQVTQQYEIIRYIVEFICKQLAQESIKDDQNIQNCLVIINKCCFHNKLTIKDLIGLQIIPAVLRLASRKNQKFELKSHQLICFISRGNSDETQQLIKNGLIEVMEQSLFSSSIKIRASACLILSNVFAQKSFIIQPLIQNHRLISIILSLFENDDDNVRFQVSFIFSNMTLNGYPPHLLALFQDTKIITYYIELLISIEKTDLETRMLLESMIRIIEFIKKYSEIYGRRSYFYLLNQINASDIASRLRKYENQDIQKNLIKLSTLKNERQNLEKQLVENLTVLY